jgi:AcrR family transcriptional regulator
MLADPSGAPLTLSALAAEAQVSRRTLYVHWGTIQQVISDAVSFEVSDVFDATGMTRREILFRLLSDERTTLEDSVTRVALTTMLSQSNQDAAAAGVVTQTAQAGCDRFSALLGPVTLDQYGQLVGPILFSEFVIRRPASDELLHTLVERGMELLGLSDDAV